MTLPYNQETAGLQQDFHLHLENALLIKMNVRLHRRKGTEAAGTGEGEKRPPPTQDPREITLLGQIIFEATRGVSIRSDIAIDDVKLQAGPCAGMEDTTEQSSGYSEDLNEIEY